jgi:hypothetical protein
MAGGRGNECHGTCLAIWRADRLTPRRFGKSIRLDLFIEMAGSPTNANFRFRF